MFAAPARNSEEKDQVQVYGNSMVVNPNGFVTARAESKETIVYYDIDIREVESQRLMMPFDKQQRDDLYQLKDLD